MGRFITATTSLTESDLEELKRKTGKSSNKEALGTAVAHYISCFCEDKYERIEHVEEKERSRAGRKPFYLAKLKRV